MDDGRQAVARAQSWHLVQITDTHLFAEPGGKLLGLDTDLSLQRVLTHVQEHDADADLFLATGDIAQDGSLAAYQRFHALLAPLTQRQPCLWMYGNHDLQQPLRAAVGPAAWVSPCVYQLGPWTIILLNSAVEHQVHGLFVPAQLQFLEQALAAAGEHVLVALHHHPVAVGSRWLDQQVVENAAAFWRIIDTCRRVRAVLFGHVHQVFEARRGAVRLLSTPSTCVQFAVGSDAFAVSAEAPGYRWLRLFADGELESGVERVAAFHFAPDFSVRGY